jgi:hypothetical protein
MIGYGENIPGIPTAANPSGDATAQTMGLYNRSVAYVTSRSGATVLAVIAAGVLGLWFLSSRRR